MLRELGVGVDMVSSFAFLMEFVDLIAIVFKYSNNFSISLAYLLQDFWMYLYDKMLYCFL